MYIGNDIKQNKYWELWMLNYFIKYYKKGTNIIDLGANIGTSPLLMSEVLSDNCKIYSFEPIYHTILHKNIIDNNLTNSIFVYPYGLGTCKETLQISNINLSETYNFGGYCIKNNISDDNCFKVQILPLDYFQFQNVSLIKIDVEHMEIEVLEGSYELIQRCKPAIIIESWQFDVLQSSNIFKKLIDLGYIINPIPEGNHDFIMTINI